ncbi:MAG: hypothetical protein HYS13_17995 [Planctomycetia bacterium]|nr:hypothetical protein [Planctomycetia bacterium]
MPQTNAMFRAAFLVLLVAFIFAQAARARDTNSADRAAQLVKQLGDASFLQREKAAAELARLGGAARKAVEEGLASKDPEVRERCRALADHIEKRDYLARLDALEQDIHNDKDPNVPGWKQFKDWFGDDRALRGVFAGMHRAEPELMRRLDGPPEALTEMIESRAAELSSDRQVRSISFQTTTALLFASLQKDAKPSADALGYLQGFVNDREFRANWASGERGEFLGRVLARWIGHTADTAPPGPAVYIALSYGLKEGVKPALKLIDQPAGQPSYLCYAALCVARFGDKSHLAAIEGLLQHEGSVAFGTVNGQVNVQVRDVALAALVQLTGQKLDAYGFEKPEKDSATLYKLPSLLLSDTARDAALTKWRDWREKNP